jgi:ABC-type sugar transport system substrate-binding protein
MKKTLIFALLLSVLLIPLAFAGGEKEGAEAGPKKLVIGFSQIDNQNPWRLAETESVKSEAAKRGYELKYSDAQAVQENQIKALRSFIAQKVDGILLAPKTETGWEPVLREAKAAKIPVVLLDRNIKVDDPSLFVTFIGSDFFFEGQEAAKQMIKDLGEGPLNIAELQGQPGADPTIQRANGFRDIIDKYPKINIILSQTGEFNRIQGKQVMEAFMKAKGKEIDVVYAHNDDMAVGAIQAIKEYGLDPGQDIYLVSVDAVRDAFEAMVAGDLNCTVECTPLLGPKGFDAIEAALRGESLPKWIKSDDQVFPMAVAKDVIGERKY